MVEIATNDEIITYIFIFTIICLKTKKKSGLKPEVCRGTHRRSLRQMCLIGYKLEIVNAALPIGVERAPNVTCFSFRAKPLLRCQDRSVFLACVQNRAGL